MDEDARLCYLLIHMLLLKPQDFKSRVQEFVKEVTMESRQLMNLKNSHPRNVHKREKDIKKEF